MSETMRLQKYLSQQGICSRRKAEEYIEAGEVFVNGQKAHIGMSITSGKDTVKLGNKAIQSQENLVYYKIYKPRGVETTCAQKDGTSIIDIINVPERVFPVGRLDKDSTGLILLTNDGRITNYLTHPRYEHEKEYIVDAFGPISDDALKKMSRGVFILGKWTKKCQIQRLATGRFSIVLTEGRNRQIRRMVEAVGQRVKKLHRIRIGDIYIDTLKQGEYKSLSSKERKHLQHIINLHTT